MGKLDGFMKKVEAIVREEKFNDVKNALDSIGVRGLTVMEVKGRGEEMGFRQQWRAFEYAVRDIPRMRIEVVVSDEAAETVANEILRAAWTGSEGDGLILISPVSYTVRVRTGERSDDLI
jgi:nitrogen regulatory protein P-II 1